jgi:hypothetical protein
MQKAIDAENINLLVIPLSVFDSESLENFLNEKIVDKRDKDEFVVVLGNDELDFPTLVSYGLTETDRYNDTIRSEVEELIQIWGAQWMKDNGFLMSH